MFLKRKQKRIYVLLEQRKLWVPLGPVKTCALVESGDGPQTRKNLYFAGPLGTLGTLENICFACFADIATLCQNTCFLQFKGFPSRIPSMGRFGTVTSVGAKCSAKSAEHESVLKFIGPQRFLAPPLKLAPPINRQSRACAPTEPEVVLLFDSRLLAAAAAAAPPVTRFFLCFLCLMVSKRARLMRSGPRPFPYIGMWSRLTTPETWRAG